MIAQAGSRMTVIRTTDRKAALKGASVALLSITVGGLEADARAAEICAKYGVMVSVGDTLGPAALARNLRTLPVVLGIARDMERWCPNALLLNFTNPMSCVTGIINRETSIRCMGLCHSAADLEIYFAKLFDEDPRNIEVTVGGVNHQAFVTSVKVRGKERMPSLLKWVDESEVELKDSLYGNVEEIPSSATSTASSAPGPPAAAATPRSSTSSSSTSAAPPNSASTQRRSAAPVSPPRDQPQRPPEIIMHGPTAPAPSRTWTSSPPSTPMN